MLTITIEAREVFDQVTETFIKNEKDVTLTLEHSLISIRKWESKWHKPFMKTKKNDEELLDYIRCMTITHNVDPEIYRCLTPKQIEEIVLYIQDSMTATWFSNNEGQVGGQKKKEETITAEIIYYWMVTLNIPVEFERWHVNQLLTLIRVVSLKQESAMNSGKNKKLSSKDRAAMAAKRQQINMERRAKTGSKG